MPEERVRESCPECGKVLILSEAARGKAVRCPGCATVLRVSPDLTLRPSEAVTPRRTAAGGPAAGFEPEDEEPDAPPRVRRPGARRRKRAGVNPWLIVGVVGGVFVLLLVVVGAGIGTWLYLQKGKDTTPSAARQESRMPPLPPGAGQGGGPGAGPLGRPEALQFNQAITNADNRLRQAGVNLGGSLSPLLQGREVDMPTVRRSYNEVKRTLDSVRADMQALQVPQTDSARRLYDAQMQFLKGQEKLINEDFDEVLQVAGKQQVPVGQRAARVRELMQGMAQKEQKDLAPLQEAQRKFAEENGIMLLPGR